MYICLDLQSRDRLYITRSRNASHPLVPLDPHERVYPHRWKLVEETTAGCGFCRAMFIKDLYLNEYLGLPI